MSNQGKLLTAEKVAERLNCTIPTVRKYIRQGKFSKFYFVGKGFLISQESFDEFLDNHNPRNPKARIT